jgi:TetR/AcrR family transcriptional repressor of nem operon
MPYTKEHKQRTRERIVQSAARLFATQGFARTSIEEIMADSQLTRGAFYSYFRSKADLYGEAMAPCASAGTLPDNAALNWLGDILGATGGTGPWSFLASDIGSNAPEVRAAYAQRVRALCRRAEEHLGAGRGADAALCAVARFVGMLAISATVDDPQLREALVTACGDCLPLLEEDVRNKDQEGYFWSPPPHGRATPLH